MHSPIQLGEHFFDFCQLYNLINKPKSEVTVPTTLNLGSILIFLDELSQHNDKAWFEKHRPAYNAVREAFEKFINDLIDELRSSDHLQGLSAKDCVARIYRDIRFSNDKSPYKTNMAAMIAPGGWRSARLGYYISIEPHAYSLVAGGLYHPTPEQLNRFRQVIDEDAATFKKLTSAKDFMEAFGALEGDRLKTAPKGYDRAHPEIALLQLKQITAMHRFSDADVLARDFAGQVVIICRTMKPFLDFLNGILR
jgi:uncharacterized protein (TIGR02453 family)